MNIIVAKKTWSERDKTEVKFQFLRAMEKVGGSIGMEIERIFPDCSSRCVKCAEKSQTNPSFHPRG